MSNADRSIWQFPKNEAGKVLGWRDNGKGMENKPWGASMSVLAALVPAANKIPYFTGADSGDLLDFKDEDDMASDSATAVPSQQSVKAYAGSQTNLDALVGKNFTSSQTDGSAVSVRNIFEKHFLTPRFFGGYTRAGLVSAIAAAQTLGLKHVLVDEDISFSAASRITLPSNITLVVNAALTNTSTSHSAGMFYFAPGTQNVLITGNGSIDGPYLSTTPVPGYADPTIPYPVGNPGNVGITIDGRVENPASLSDAPCSNIVIAGPQIRGWGLSGILAENVHGGGVFRPTQISKCGRDGIRKYGCDHFDTDGLHIESIKPGLDGVAPLLNAYAITNTRRADKINLYNWTHNDLTYADWTATGVTAANDAIDGSWTDWIGVQRKLGKITEDTTTGAHLISREFSGLTLSGVHTMSCEAKAGTRSILRLTMIADGTAHFIRAHFNLATGVVISSGANGNGVLTEAKIVDLGDGIYKCVLKGVPDSSASVSVVETGFQMLSVNVSLTNGGSYTGDGASLLYMGETQLWAGNIDWFADSWRQNPPSRNCKDINGSGDDHPTWSFLDSHGGIDITFDNWDIENCANAVGIDEGKTTGSVPAGIAIDMVPRNIHIDNIRARRGYGEAGMSFINADGQNADGRGDGLYIGPGCKGDGFGASVGGAITISYFDNVDCNFPWVENNDRAGLYLLAGPVTGRFGINVKNITNTIAAVVVNDSDINADLVGGRFMRTTGTFIAFSIATPDLADNIRLGDDFKFVGAVTRWASASHIGRISPSSPFLDRRHAFARTPSAGTGATTLGVSVSKSATGVYDYTLTTAVTDTNYAQAVVELPHGSSARTHTVTWASTTSFTVRTFDAAGAAVDNDHKVTVRAP